MSSTRTVKKLARDLVCGMEVELTPQTLRAVHSGTTYYFDSVDCAMKFQANPEPFLNPPEVT